jgi:hypothetical protein
LKKNQPWLSPSVQNWSNAEPLLGRSA